MRELLNKQTRKLTMFHILFVIVTLIFLLIVLVISSHFKTGMLLIYLGLFGLLLLISHLLLSQQQRKRLYQKLFEEEKNIRLNLEEYKTIFDSIGDCVITTDAEGKINRMNPAAEKLTGWSSREAKGRSFREILRIISKSDWNDVELPRIDSDTVKLEKEYYLLGCKDREEVPVSGARSDITDQNGKLSGSIFVIHDLTNKLLSARLLQSRINLIEFSAGNSIIDIVRQSLREICILTKSKFGLIRFIDNDLLNEPIEIWCNSRNNEFRFTELTNKQSQSSALYADCVESGRILINNSNRLKLVTGFQKEPVIITRNLLIPILRDELIIGVISLANKASDYTASDADSVSFLADISFEIILKKKTEDLTRINESRLLRAEEVSRSGNFEIHLLTGKVYASRGARIIYGIDSEVTDYELIKQVPLKEYRSILDDAFRNAVEKDEPYDVEFKIRSCDKGELKHVHSKGTWDTNRQILFGVIQDITLKRNAEIALNEKNEELNTYFNSSLDLICIANTDGYFIRLNPEWQKVLGYPLNYLEGRKFIDFVHPEDHERTLSVLSRLKLQRDVQNFENRYQCIDGSYRWIEWRSKPSGSKIYAVARDITDRKKAESALRDREAFISNLLETLPIPVYFKNTQGRYLNVNNAFSELTGYRRELLINNTICSLFPKETADHFTMKERELIKSGGSSISEIRMKSATGAEHTLIAHLTVSKDSSGEVNGILGALLNVTEIRKTEENLVKLNRNLNNLNQTKDKLLSIIGHDLKSPFSGILGLVELLIENIEKYPPEKSGMFLQEVAASTKNSIILIDNLLSWAKSQSGQIDFYPEILKLQPIMEEVTDLFQSSIILKKIRLVVNPCDFQVFADKNMLKAIMRNLLANAVKFTCTGGNIEIRTLLTENYARISVKDNGVGMSSETQKMLFRLDNYFSTEGTMKEKGSGLGLIICKEFVERNGGKINVISQLAKGSEFSITLPVKANNC
ncbi:MAG TPA: PAS domain S-box protein [Bacteroidales bacterium]|nr:PAS domain S-box protein [Bacteroidales bacterium]